MDGVNFSCFFTFLVALVGFGACVQYEPTWESLDKRPLPSWYDESKLGIFIHWGVFSVPAFGGSIKSRPSSAEWFWYRWKHVKEPEIDAFMKENYPPGFDYADFAPMFTGEFYDPNEWADMFAASGARYVVLTTKHHEGFCNWPTNHSFNWNSMATGPHRDITGEFATAIRSKTDLHMGLYHSLYEWFHPLYMRDVESNFTTQDFPREKTLPELYEIVKTYKPEVVWSDGPIGPDYYWNSTTFLAWLYNESPVKDIVVTNDRWGNNDIKCKHGGYWTCRDNYNPGYLMPHKWERSMTMTPGTWGYNRRDHLNKYMSTQQIITALVETVSCGGNLLLNVAPTHDGRILPVYEERLRQLGQWMKINGDAIYKTKPWKHQNDTVTGDTWYTQKSPDVYAIMLSWPEGEILELGAVTPTPNTQVSILGYDGAQLPWMKRAGGGITVKLPVIPFNKDPTPWSKVLLLKNIQ